MTRPTPARQHRSFRFAPATLDRLDRRAHQIRESRTALAERYVEEGLRMDEHAGIGFADGPAGRRPVLTGTGLDVWEVVETVRQSAKSVEQAAAYLDLPVAGVRGAVRYYAAFPDEIDEWVESVRTLAEQEHEAARRERAVLE